MGDTLFSQVADLSPENVDVEVIAALPSSRDPRTMDWWDETVNDLWYDNFEADAVEGDSTFIPTVGTLTVLASWGEPKDENEVGFVVSHEETGKDYLFECTWTSWDGQDWTCVEAEQYTFTEQRWRAV